MLQFSKYQGLGNDFMVMSISKESYLNTIEALTPNKIKELCDRRYGIGADGIILCLSSTNECDIRMQIFNSDGTEAEMCGNGIRCLVKYMFDNNLMNSAKEITIETLAGKIEAIVNPDKTIKVDMGTPVLVPSEIPTKLEVNKAGLPSSIIELDGDYYNIYSVGMGNPHLIMFVKDLNSVNVEAWGKKLEFHRDFPSNTNVHFVEVLSRSNLVVKVWERGCGETLACGTGACASVVASKLLDYSASDVNVKLPGGELFIQWSSLHSTILMTGPADFVFSGLISTNMLQPSS